MEAPWIFLSALTVHASMAVVFATLGEIITERSGVLNLGVEGMMLMGALTGFAAARSSGDVWVGVLAAGAVGAALALLHAFFCISMKVNQIVSGLALTLLGSGLSNFLGRPIIGKKAVAMDAFKLPVLGDIPGLGPILFHQPPLAYAGFLLVPVISWYLYRTRPGLHLRVVGENPAAADTVGLSVFGIRYAHTAAGGLLAGIGGAYLSLCYTPGWKEGITAGQGWIAIALVIFGTWDPLKAVLGALLFGFLNALQFYGQAAGITILPEYILRMLPYLFTIGVLGVISSGAIKKISGEGPPAALLKPYERER